MSELNVNIYDEKVKDQNSILKKHINNYMIGVSRVIFFTFLTILIADIAVTIFIHYGYFTNYLKSRTGSPITYCTFVKRQIIDQIIIWGSILLYYILWPKASFSTKKTLLCALCLLTICTFCFGHWANIYLSILFLVPIIITIPFDIKRNTIVFYTCFGMTLLFSTYQYLIYKDEKLILIGLSSIIVIVASHLICRKLHNTINNLIFDIKYFAKKEEILSHKLAHDVLTESFSKAALEAELPNIENYNSISFIDVDDFKSINDNEGHNMGDNILKLLVYCLSTDNKKMFRYGGDEFVALSTLSAIELGKDLTRLKERFSYYAKELFNLKVTISIGIISVNKSLSGEENISLCDALMYKSKEKGKNTLTIG